MFSRWCCRHGRSQELVNLDVSLADYMDVLLHDGVLASEGEKVIAAVVKSFPRLSRKELVQANETLRGFQKSKPGVARRGLNVAVMAGIAAEGMKMKRAFALAVVTAMECYLRPSEMEALRVSDFAVPLVTRGHQYHTLRIAPAEHGQPSKTGTFDDTVTVDQPEWLGGC